MREEVGGQEGRKEQPNRGFEAADHQWLAAVARISSMMRKEHRMVVQSLLEGGGRAAPGF